MLDSNSISRVLSEMSGEGQFGQIRGFAYRSVALRHFIEPAEPSPLHTALPGKLGSRFQSPSREIRTLYIAIEAETAHREGNQAFYRVLEQMGPDTHELFPAEEAVLLGLRVVLMRLLDLRDPAIQTRLGTGPEELAGPWKTVPNAPTQRLGDAIVDSREFDGLIYSSVRHSNGTCLALFPDRLGAGSMVEFVSRTLKLPSAVLSNPRE